MVKIPLLKKNGSKYVELRLGYAVVNSSAVDETVRKELSSCNVGETIASTDGQCGVSR